jgi:D-arabinono-1,4-lactone oxidase
MPLDPNVQAELVRLDPTVPFHHCTSHLHRTWARTFYSRPELYLQPESLPEIQTIVTLARRCRKRIVVVGNGHSPSDLTCTSSWMVNLDYFNKVLEYDVDDTPGSVRFQAGISLYDLNQQLATRNLTLPNLGSVDVQSMAGAISTGTHGSSLYHGLLSQSITAITLVLANGQPVRCSATTNPALFRAALLSLGALGIIVEITLQAVPDFNISWNQTLVPLSSIYSHWSTSLWSSAEYTRVWWLPYLSRAVVWRANHTTEAPKPPETTFYGGKLGFYTYHNLLYLSHYIPRLLPWVEWFIFGMQYGFTPGSYSMTAVEPARDGLKMDCLYSQFVNEWALPLAKGPEAITRLSAWINGDAKTAKIPFSSKGVWVHCPIEVRLSDTSTERNKSGVRPFLDPTVTDGPTLYLNATLYRPYGLDPPCRKRYYEAFEWLMRDMGGRPHWAKNFGFTTAADIKEMYGADMTRFISVRDEVDPDGMFVGEWHRRNLGVGVGLQLNAQSMVEAEARVEKLGKRRGGWGDGLLWIGERIMRDAGEWMERERDVREVDVGLFFGNANEDDTPSPVATSISDESFDYMAKGEASVYAEGLIDEL